VNSRVPTERLQFNPPTQDGVSPSIGTARARLGFGRQTVLVLEKNEWDAVMC
jgi:hypothetical protein